ncbi:MAG: peptidoglycan -binding protein [Magnetospirillum sp.]|nr:peptidoglycan -binding protein [Magnetospirillum sp.]
MAARRLRPAPDIWPGFVDALASLVMVVVFVLLVFVLAQVFLGQALSNRNQVIGTLGREMAALVEQLSLQKTATVTLQANLDRLDGELASALAERDAAVATAAGLEHDIAALEALKAALETQVAGLDAALGESRGQVESERKISEEARAQAALLNRQIEALKRDLARIAAALEASELRDREQQVQILDLSKRLNVALAAKVEELQKYRSEFFGRLRKVLGDRPGIRIEGDRFALQSELLFDTASAELGGNGREQVRKLAATLKDITRTMPKDINWILRIDGHTDRRPIASGRFPSNWELSTARAISVVRTLVAEGIPPERLAATGMGEFQPLDPADTEPAYSRNRRIELRLDQR